jgi:hypothetical protein
MFGEKGQTQGYIFFYVHKDISNLSPVYESDSVGGQSNTPQYPSSSHPSKSSSSINRLAGNYINETENNNSNHNYHSKTFSQNYAVSNRSKDLEGGGVASVGSRTSFNNMTTYNYTNSNKYI